MSRRRIHVNNEFLYFTVPNKRTLKKIVHLHGFEKRDGRCRLPDTRINRLIIQSAGYYIYFPVTEPPNPFKNRPEWKELSTKLRPYQQEGVLYLNHFKKILLGDEQGLGKTVQVLSWLFMRPDISPVIIVCPSHLKENWRREALKWSGEEAEILESQTPYPVKSDILIINYEILIHWLPFLQDLNPQCIAIDECQRIKNRKSKTSKAVKSLAEDCEYIIPMSGTPIKNRPEEFYSVLNLLSPEEFPNFLSFAALYCNPKKIGQWWDYSGSENTAELHDRINNRLMVRRLKKDHLKELPDKEIISVPISLHPDSLKDYRQVLKEMFAEKAKRPKDREKNNWMEKLKQECVKAKLPAVKEWTENFLESSGEKLILFTSHHLTIDYLQEAFSDVCVVVDGRTSNSKKRQAAIDSFQNDPKVKLFLGNLKSAGEGLTLTAASTVAFVELEWSPADHSQGEDRVHRFGQAADQVSSYYLIVPGTIEDKIWEMLESKRKVLGEIIDGKTKEVSTIDKVQLFQWLRKEAA